MGAIFINYRRQDAQSAAGRLTDGLERVFGKDVLFRDVLAIPAGSDFADEIERSLESCVVLLTVIGAQWLKVVNTEGRKRLDDPADFVRRELEAALKRNILVVPVLVDGAAMPTEADLPDGLKQLARRQAHELTDKRWDYDLGKLVEQLAQVEGLSTSGALVPATRGRPLLSAVLVIVALIAIALVYAGDRLPSWVGFDSLIPAEIRDRPRDGGTMLAVAVLVILLWRVSSHRFKAVLPRVLGEWAKGGHALPLIAAGMLALLILIALGKLISAAVLLVIAVAFWATARWASGLYASTARATALGAAALIAFGTALLWADPAIEKLRQSAFDVAFVLPPEGGYSDNAKLIFDRMTHAFRTSLKDVKTVEILPDKLTQDEFNTLTLSNESALNKKKGKGGSARIFVQVKYNLEGQPLNILVTPRYRHAIGERIAPVSSWTHDAWSARATPDEIKGAALKAAFEVITLLSSERMKMIKLTPEEQQQTWRNILEEYYELLAVTAPQCAAKDKVKAMLSTRGPLDEKEVKSVLEEPCGDPQSQPRVPNGIETAARVYGAALAPEQRAANQP